MPSNTIPLKIFRLVSRLAHFSRASLYDSISFFAFFARAFSFSSISSRNASRASGVSRWLKWPLRSV
jgi:hypothetical protein